MSSYQILFITYSTKVVFMTFKTGVLALQRTGFPCLVTRSLTLGRMKLQIDPAALPGIVIILYCRHYFT